MLYSNITNSYFFQDAKSLQLYVVTVDGSVEVFDHQLNGSVKKPLKPRCCLQFSTAAGMKLPVKACHSRAADQLIVMYGTAVCPAFETVELVGIIYKLLQFHLPMELSSQTLCLLQNQHSDVDISLVREDPSLSVNVMRLSSVGNIKQPRIDSDVTTLMPAVEGGKKLGAKRSKPSEKRPLEQGEVCVPYAAPLHYLLLFHLSDLFMALHSIM